MPRALVFLFAVLSAGVAVAACNGGGAVSPTPAPSYSATPDPAIKYAIIQVQVLGTPKPGVPVAESTPRDPNSPRPGTTIAVMTTNAHGKAKFTGLKPSATYCWVATVSPNNTISTCADWVDWQSENPLVLNSVGK
ncbi:MAG TPA: hypothetical protein VMF61_13025 [Candidatus Acidoferrales bacterium]|nr:hypothetical protein [Candidatus Acidoferrales bacterium]